MSPESEFVDVTYRGLKVAHKARVRDATSDGAFVELETPLPVGAMVVVVRESGTRDARVASVVEHEANAKSPPGMKLTWAQAAVAPPADHAASAAEQGATPDATPETVDDEGGMSGPVDASGAKKRRGGKKKNGR